METIIEGGACMTKNDVIVKIALITLGNINAYFADNKKPLTLNTFMKIQLDSVEEAKK